MNASSDASERKGGPIVSAHDVVKLYRVGDQDVRVSTAS